MSDPLTIIIPIYLFVIGLFVGSFYNVVAIRLCKNESIVFPGSHCVNCNHKLSWYELIPVFSWVFLGGRCKSCHKKISIQYPLIELLTAVMFSCCYLLYGNSFNTAIAIVLSSIAIITLITDTRWMIILDEVIIIGGILLAILYFVGFGTDVFISHLIGGVVLFLIMLLVKLIADFAFKTESLGWGDIKLSLIAGLILELKLGIVYIFLGAILALPYGLFTSIKKKESLLPFGPFLVLSIIILFVFNEQALSLLKLLMGV